MFFVYQKDNACHICEGSILGILRLAVYVYKASKECIYDLEVRCFEVDVTQYDFPK